MFTKEGLYRRFAGRVPAWAKERVAKMLRYAGIEADLDLWLGSRVFISFLFALAAALVPWTVLKYYNILIISRALFASTQALPAVYLSIGGAMATFFFVLFMFYMHLFYVIEDRSRRIEDVLPDFFTLIVANLHAGMPVFQAFTHAAKPEFGPLEEEVKKAATRASFNESLSQALVDLSESVDSPVFKRTIGLFERGIRSGGSISMLLEKTSEEVRKTQEMSKELQAATRTYALFLGFIMVILMPVLFAVSIQFLGMFISISSNYALQSSSFNIPMFSGKIGVSVDFIIMISYVMMVACSLLASLLMGVVYKGKELYGLKYFPIISLLAFVVFLVARVVVGQIISPFE